MSLGAVLLLNLGVVLALTTALWALSVAVRDTSIVDVFWGAGFVAIAWVTWAAAGHGSPRALLLVLLTTAWGLRLTLHLARRNLGKGEDFRYRAMRARHGDRWPVRSLWAVFWSQGLLMWIVALPVQAGQVDPTAHALTWLGIAVGAAVWLTGFLFETIGDAQLARFKTDPENAGTVMDRGLWAWTRHPNYFGDCCVWWGLWLVACASGNVWWTAVGPVVMTVLLVRVSGKALLEKDMARRRPQYAAYVERTSGFIPRPPRRG
jgi:steroid 5-alpha reductase family enzyme